MCLKTNKVFLGFFCVSKDWGIQGADPSEISSHCRFGHPIGEPGECAWEGRHILHSLQQRGPAEGKNSGFPAFPQPPTPHRPSEGSIPGLMLLTQVVLTSFLRLDKFEVHE
jgi:hypothetical protein